MPQRLQTLGILDTRLRSLVLFDDDLKEFSPEDDRFLDKLD